VALSSGIEVADAPSAAKPSHNTAVQTYTVRVYALEILPEGFV
jgi:hypothetical protein